MDGVRRTDVDAVDDGKGYVERKVGSGIVDSVQGQHHGGNDGHDVFAAVDEVRKHIARVLVSSDTLEESPDGRQRQEETE